VRWRRATAINAAGACATGFVTAVVIATKFLHGAWIVVAAMPLIVIGLQRLHRHYRSVENALARGRVRPIDEDVHNVVVLYVEHVDAACHEALAYVHWLEEDAAHAIHVAGRGTARDVRTEWERLGDPLELSVLETEGQDHVDTVIQHVDALERPDGEHFVTVVTPAKKRPRATARG